MGRTYPLDPRERVVAVVAAGRTAGRWRRRINEHRWCGYVRFGKNDVLSSAFGPVKAVQAEDSAE
jgi:hypothetical protein